MSGEVGDVSHSYGHFSTSEREYVITDPRVPRPWANVIANPRVGLIVSQTGSGYSWIDNSQLAAVTRWQQDLAEDRSGRFLYLLDLDSGAVASLAPAPCWPAYDRYACAHGLGYTRFECSFGGLASSWTLGVDEEAAAELWRVRLESLDGRSRRLALVPFLEWNCGVSPAPRREFQKLFLETRWLPGPRAIVAGGHMWDVSSERWGHWNRDFPFWSALVAAQSVAAAEGDKGAFLGRGRDWRRPAALDAGAPWQERFGRHHDPVAVLFCPLQLAPATPFEGGFVLATAEAAEEAVALGSRFATVAALDAGLAAARRGWQRRLEGHRLETPDETLDALLNDWLRYQAISARLWGRAGYYQQSGAYGFRDQLQDSQIWLTLDPPRCRAQISLHAAHQFADGSVYHWWHPLSEQGHVTRMSDDLLWLAFVAARYVRETGDLGLLDDPVPYLDDARSQPLLDHVERAFARVRRRTGPRGLPFIGGGDWNDGLSALGLQERGESVWLAELAAGLASDWAEIHRRRGAVERGEELDAWRRELVTAVNEHGWDGAWYRRASRDDGSWIGSAACREGQIFLNAQTWAILNDVAPPERAERCLDAIEQRLVDDAGALLLAPAYEGPDETIGYVTRYAPGLRENGGVYTHAAVWAIAAAAKLRRPALVARLLSAIDPSRKDPERYWAEPYVLPGNVDGPASPWHGRAGWTWYTGSAAWLPQIVSEWVLGVRPTWDGLLFDPCLPSGWSRAALHRPWRGARLEITIERLPGRGPGEVTLELDGALQREPVLREVAPGAREVRVLCG